MHAISHIIYPPGNVYCVFLEKFFVNDSLYIWLIAWLYFMFPSDMRFINSRILWFSGMFLYMSAGRVSRSMVILFFF